MGIDEKVRKEPLAWIDFLKGLREHELIGVSCYNSDEKNCTHIGCVENTPRGNHKHFSVPFRYITKNKLEVQYNICYFKARGLKHTYGEKK
jgi:hypothetical protein